LLGWQPDITAPGVDVIAAYSEEVPATDLSFEDRQVPYNMISGTSMACPHVAGVAGLIKAKYPGWSPAMIKSAIMTTGESTAIAAINFVHRALQSHRLIMVTCFSV
jgi:subtilisin family serine protease